MQQPETVVEHLQVSLKKNGAEISRLQNLVTEFEAALEKLRIEFNVTETYAAQSDALHLEQELTGLRRALAEREEVGSKLAARLSELGGERPVESDNDDEDYGEPSSEDRPAGEGTFSSLQLDAAMPPRFVGRFRVKGSSMPMD